ncbi:MAG: hypothetical protein E7661_07765 [Ruminococcaceae bacterium]|nr:hypothetical protein [Oscillospiraceae bacterium]
MSRDEKQNTREEINRRDRDLDEFWDIDRLLPQQKSAPKYTPVTTRKTPEAIEIEVPSPKEPKKPVIRTVTVPPTGSSPLSFSHEEKPVADDIPPDRRESVVGEKAGPIPVLLCEYAPDNLLLHNVKVYEWHSNYHYFDQFIKDAVAYARVGGKETKAEPFFSYFPQYAQLNRRQRAWYLYWRDQVRAEIYPQTDYAYILLYLFELINLPVEEDMAEEHRDLMAKVWMAYRKTYPQLDHYACEWLCDYCLIHRLSAPILHLLPALGQIISMARLKEFYLSAMISVGNDKVNVASAKVLLSYSCQYDYRKSKFYSGEHKALFDDVIPRALAEVFPMLIARGQPVAGLHGGQSYMQDSVVSRDAFVGALCAYSCKRRIELSYASFSRSHDLRFLVGDMVKHVENRIRAAILVRSKLTTHFLTVPLRQALDTWLDDHLPSPEVAKRRAEMNKPRPEYEALYDLPHTAVSIESADAIEQSSWETTKILVEAFVDEELSPVPEEGMDDITSVPISSPPLEESAPAAETAPSCESPEDVDSPLLQALGDRAEFVLAVLRRDRAGQKAYCAVHKKLPDAVVDEINDLTVEHEIFDMIIEENGCGGYQIIEDYRDMIKEILNV